MRHACTWVVVAFLAVATTCCPSYGAAPNLTVGEEDTVPKGTDRSGAPTSAATTTIETKEGKPLEVKIVGQDGKPGPKGDRGYSGARGRRGSRGSKGLHGPEGKVGPQGPAGPQGQRGPKGEVVKKLPEDLKMAAAALVFFIGASVLAIFVLLPFAARDCD